jgi:hypothetical protein
MIPPDSPDPVPSRPSSSLAATITASAATFTAIVAVLIALWDNVQTRHHNRLSVMPYLVLDRTQHDSAGVMYGSLAVSNEGVGPAILQKLEIRVAGADGRDHAPRSWSEAAPTLQTFGVRIRGWAEVDSGSALGVQRGTVLLRVQASGDSGRAQIQSMLDHTRLRIRYASIYGESREATLGNW